MTYHTLGLSRQQRTLVDEVCVVDEDQKGISETDPVAVAEQPARTGRTTTLVVLGVNGDVVDEQLVFRTVALDIDVSTHHVESHTVLEGVDLFIILLLRAGELVPKGSWSAMNPSIRGAGNHDGLAAEGGNATLRRERVGTHWDMGIFISSTSGLVSDSSTLIGPDSHVVSKHVYMEDYMEEGQKGQDSCALLTAVPLGRDQVDGSQNGYGGRRPPGIAGGSHVGLFGISIE